MTPAPVTRAAAASAATITRAMRAPAVKPRSARLSRDDGQATVELVALLPLLLIAALAGAALIAAHTAGEQAGQAAEAGAVALLQGGDAREAARRALPSGSRADIDVRGRRVTVTVRPRLPITALERPLVARATADAGPGAAP